MFLAKVYVTLKPLVNDPQGIAILGGLHNMGYKSVEGVRAGKYLELQINETNKPKAEEVVTEMAQKLLANVVIEDFRFELDQIK